MLILCTNRGCIKHSNALLDTKTMDIICQECGKPIDNISESMKRTLKSFGRVIKEEKKAFSMGCRSCNANREIVFDENKNTICAICKGPVGVHAAMKAAMEEAGVRVIEQNKKGTKKVKKTSGRKKKEQTQ